MTTIQVMPAAVTHRLDVARWSAPTSRKPYEPAIWARFAITITSAAKMPQPPIQPQEAPNARVAQVKVVPQSGSASFSSL